MSNLKLGLKGEDLAEDFLKKQGYRILKKSFRTSFGQIDIIAKEKKTLCFVEVKTRSSLEFGLPQEAVHPLKQKRIIKTALVYLKDNQLLDRPVRFDVVSIQYRDNLPKIELIRNAFELND